jgi:hypothetical protein
MGPRGRTKFSLADSGRAAYPLCVLLGGRRRRDPPRPSHLTRTKLEAWDSTFIAGGPSPIPRSKMLILLRPGRGLERHGPPSRRPNREQDIRRGPAQEIPERSHSPAPAPGGAAGYICRGCPTGGRSRPRWVLRVVLVFLFWLSPMLALGASLCTRKRFSTRSPTLGSAPV